MVLREYMVSLKKARGLTHLDSRNGSLASQTLTRKRGSGDTAIVELCSSIIFPCVMTISSHLHVHPKLGNSTIAVSPDPLFRVRVWLARLQKWLLAQLASGSKPTLPSCCHTRSRALARSPLTLAFLGCL